MIKKHQTTKKRKNKAPITDPKVLTVGGHIQELRQRLFYIVSFLVLFTAVGYVIREQLIEILLHPAESQQFIYTSPVGGFDFIFRICLYFGLAVSVPILMYNLFQYLAPLLPSRSRGFVLKATLVSYLLAITGICFGYFASLPAALDFLLNQFGTDQIQALLSIQEYMSFVMVYLVGFALLFQIPIVLLFVNRITPLRPAQLLGYQRYVIVGAMILSAILTPTADIVNMMIMAVPIVFMYQFGVVLVLLQNRRKKPVSVTPSISTSPAPVATRPVLATQPIKQTPVPTPALQHATAIYYPTSTPPTPIKLRPLPLNSRYVIQ